MLIKWYHKCDYMSVWIIIFILKTLKNTPIIHLADWNFLSGSVVCYILVSDINLVCSFSCNLMREKCRWQQLMKMWITRIKQFMVVTL